MIRSHQLSSIVRTLTVAAPLSPTPTVAAACLPLRRSYLATQYERLVRSQTITESDFWNSAAVRKIAHLPTMADPPQKVGRQKWCSRTAVPSKVQAALAQASPPTLPTTSMPTQQYIERQLLKPCSPALPLQVGLPNQAAQPQALAHGGLNQLSITINRSDLDQILDEKPHIKRAYLAQVGSY